MTIAGATAELAHLARALKAPRIGRVAGPLAERARAEGWDYQRYLAAVLEEEVLAREAAGRLQAKDVQVQVADLGRYDQLVEVGS